MRAVVVRAPAKVNLDLRVLGLRPDGYHELRTLYQAIELHDTLTFVSRPGPFTIACRAHGVPRDERNLVWHAAAALWSALGRSGPPRDVAVRIDKVIPTQAGLAGGSTDGAAALRGLARVWGAGDEVALDTLAARIGADVAFFLTGGSALGLGKGEDIYRLADLPRYWIVLAWPGFGVSTVEAYRWWDEDRAHEREEQKPQYLPGLLHGRVAEMANDLEPPVARRHPDIRRWTTRLREAGAEAAAMSGSGSAVFGLFTSRARAVRAASALSGARPRVLLTRTLSAREYERLAQPVAKRR